MPNHALRNSVQEYIALQQAAVKREKAANAPGNDHGGGGERLGTVEDGEADDYSVELTRVRRCSSCSFVLGVALGRRPTEVP